jgi:hypothetical protein
MIHNVACVCVCVCVCVFVSLFAIPQQAVALWEVRFEYQTILQSLAAHYGYRAMQQVACRLLCVLWAESDQPYEPMARGAVDTPTQRTCW